MSSLEIELKLAVAPSDMDRLRGLSCLSDTIAKPKVKSLDSIYFDTEDRRLVAAGLSLRVRRVGRKLIQTLKSAPKPGAGALVRGEWEVEVAHPRPDLSLLPDPTVIEGLGEIANDDLVPVFETRIRRQIRHLSPRAGLVVEVALDQGEIVAPGGLSLPVHEAELELTEGTDTAALYDLARAIHAEVPVRLEMETKSARGYALSSGATPVSAKATKLVLAPDATVEDALSAIVRHCLGHMMANEPVTRLGRDPEGVHQMRVALRRLRSALQIFKPFIPADQMDSLGPRVKDLASALGPAREWDVFLGELLPPVSVALQGHDGLASLEMAARAARDRGYAQVRATLADPAHTALLLDLAAWVDGRGWRNQPVSEQSTLLLSPVIDMAGALLDKRHRQARKRGRGFARLAPAPRHELRISLKKLRYAADFFRSLYEGKALRRFLEDMSAFQDRLGHLQDVATVDKLVAELEGTAGAALPADWRLGAGLVAGWHARGLHDLEEDTVADWHRFADAKPFWQDGKEDGDGER
ncbi:CHAD domain-containing protein [Niveispirillum sp. KHB5.9]|uniref:CYTH and CHAD domain-containing protein n=1 Tax=Niveispirillum sp. KHB5.9 TaxID=3400269 RepID=UPI003A8362BB